MSSNPATLAVESFWGVPFSCNWYRLSLAVHLVHPKKNENHVQPALELDIGLAILVG